MSYNDQDDAPFGDTFDYVITPQMADIYAVQSIYGSTSTRADGTTYGFNSTAGSIYDFASYSGTPAFTIYDSGGIDLLDCSLYTVSQTINLNPGTWSSIGGYVGNIGIYLNVIIEDANGGAGDDIIIGNGVDNVLNGGAGAADRAIFNGNFGSYSVVSVSQSSGQVIINGAEGYDTFLGVEWFQFQDQTYWWQDLGPSSVLSIAAANAVQTEGDSGSRAFTFTVTRSGDTSVASSVNWSLSHVSTNASDFVGATSGPLSWAANDTSSRTITVYVAGDTVYENGGADELFNVVLSGASGAQIGTSSAQGRIQNDDPPPQPDLVVDVITAPTSVLQGQTLSFSYVITNTGDVAATPGSGLGPNSYAGIFVDEQPNQSHYAGYNALGSLAAHASMTLGNSINTANLSVGQHTLWVSADNWGYVSEGNEGNNARSFTFNVTAPANSYTYATLEDSADTSSHIAFGIDDMGDIVGRYTDGSGGLHGFLFSDGNYTTLDRPSAKSTAALGVNDTGQIVERYTDGSGAHGFVYSGGSYTTLDHPSAISGGTVATGMNDAGQVVGYYLDGSSNWHSFLYTGDQYITLDDRLATEGTFAQGINDTGFIVGIYENASGSHGFFADPHGPAANAQHDWLVS